MCYKRIEKGLNPNCVDVCPTKTRTFGLYDIKLEEGAKIAEQKNGVLLYSGETSTLYVVTRDAFEKITNSPDVTVVKNGYPADSRWVTDLMKYSRLAWIPMVLGTTLYIAKWIRGQPKGTP
jgi:hypothetical protein